MEYLWKPGQVGTLPDLTYGRPSLGPSMKFCVFNIKPFPEVSLPGTAGLAEFASCAVGNRLASCFSVEDVYLLISSRPGISVPASPAQQLLPVCEPQALPLCVRFSLHQDLGERSGLSG